MKMKKILTFAIGLFLIGFVMTPLAQTEPRKFLGKDVEILPLKDIKPGMIGYGLSVFNESQRAERFEVKIETISFYVKNKYIIWAKAWGGPNNIVSRAGIIAGMSGSPIYLKDPKDNQWKLIGALAYGYPFQPPSEALAGIVPIEEMLGLQKLIAAYYFQSSQNPDYEMPKFFPDPEKIRIPLRLVGNKAAIELFSAELKKRVPFELYKQPEFESRTTQRPVIASQNTLTEGEAVAVVISIGDLSFAAVGTVTLANSNGFLAFGHPFLWTGISNFPVFRAEIGMTVPSLESSFKELKNIPQPQLGTIAIDSLEGILGIWHDNPTLIPVNIRFAQSHLNNLQRQENWYIQMGKNNLFGSQLVVIAILYAIEFGSPSLFNLSFDIETTFIYKDNGIDQKLSIRKSFFDNKGDKIIPNIISFGAIYTMFEKAKKDLVGIDIDINTTQEKSEISTLYLSSIEPEKTQVKPKEELSLGLMLTDQEKNYTRTIKLKAPDFQGEMRIKIQDSDSRLQNLVAEAISEPAKITKVFDFVKMATGKRNVFYIETQYIKSITEHQGKDNKGWQETDKKTEELVNTEIIEVEAPKIPEKFNINISGQRIISVRGENLNDAIKKVVEETVKEVNNQVRQNNAIKFKPALFLNLPLGGISSDTKGVLRTNLIGIDVGLIEYKRVKFLNFGFGINTRFNNLELFAKFAPVKIRLWKSLFVETSVAVNADGKFLLGTGFSIKL